MTPRGQPAIVVVAYARPSCLSRLLRSLERGEYEAGLEIPLVISLDGGASRECVDIAHRFRWTHGDKRVVAHHEHMGLRRHVLCCGDLSEEYGAVILLEDDLYVAPHFHAYASEALARCANDDRIAGVSLYSMRTNEDARGPFEPLDDGSDVYFLQLPSSWGQAWSSEQWRAFRGWLADESAAKDWRGVPLGVRAWPETSWKKHMVRYLVRRERWFMFPRRSLTTNFGDSGTHQDRRVHHLQVPLQLASRPWTWASLDASGAVYDAFMELSPHVVARYRVELDPARLTVDLYGRKPVNELRRGDLVLTGRATSRCVRRYDGEMRPHELGVLLDEPGERISLAESDDAETWGPPPSSRAFDVPVPLVREALSATQRALSLSVSRRIERVRARWSGR